MKAEILLFPYDAAEDKSLFHLLIRELSSGGWTRLRAAVAFARVSGNSGELLDALVNFASSGGSVSLTFGADTFGTDSGSDLQAIEILVSRLEPYPNATIHLYHESGRTFHPKIYLLDHEANGEALIIVGSSNWSYGGLADNIEANILIYLSLNVEDEREIYDRLEYCFANYWTES
jgi:HKD family nuclease